MKDTAWIRCPLCDHDDADQLFTHEGFQHVRCRHCDLLYVNPRMTDMAEFSATLFGREHPVWSKASGNFQSLSKPEQEAFLERMQKHPTRKYRRELGRFETHRNTGRILDVGCADGKFLLAAQGAGWQVKGVEVSPENSGLCREGYGLDVFTGTLDQADLEEGAYDGVRLNQVIEHVDDPLHLLLDINRALRPGGLISLATVNIKSFTYSILGSQWSYLGSNGNGHIVFFSRETLNRALEETGFSAQKWSTIGCRIRNSGATGNPISRRGIRTTEKALGALAALTGKGGRIHVYAVKK